MLELFGQTQFMREILKSVRNHCCDTITIICPCSKEELRHLVDFLYDGEIRCGSKTEAMKIQGNLNAIFGYPEDLDFKNVTNDQYYFENVVVIPVINNSVDHQMNDSMDDPLINAMNNPTRNEIDHPMVNNIGKSMINSINISMNNRIDNSLNNPMHDKISNAMHHSMFKAMDYPMINANDNSMINAMNDPINAMDDQMQNSVDYQMIIPKGLTQDSNSLQNVTITPQGPNPHPRRIWKWIRPRTKKLYRSQPLTKALEYEPILQQTQEPQLSEDICVRENVVTKTEEGNKEGYDECYNDEDALNSIGEEHRGFTQCPISLKNWE